MRQRARLILFVLTALSPGCGSSPVSPFAGPPTLLSISVNLNTPAVGSTVQATGTANLTGSLTSNITTGFSGDAPTIATVSSSGVVTGLAIGDVTISVDYQGMRGSKKVRILPNYAGTFTGSYRVDGCTETQGWIGTGFCSSITIGSIFAVGLSTIQSPDLTQVAGVFQLGAQQTSIQSSAVAADGSIAFTSLAVSGTSRLDVSLAGTTPAAGQITGTFVQQYSDQTRSGNARVTCTLLSLTRSAGGS
jgi:hypothetical protein